jgi:uncharacterized protein (TIGR03663 family)
VGSARAISWINSRSFWALLALLGALLIRLPDVQSRPFHTDEAVNAFLLEETFERGGFKYRAHDHHGPTLFFAAAAILRPAGATKVSQMEPWMLRLISVAFGALAAASMYAFAHYVGINAAHASALLVGISAPFVYYSGIFIHESLLLLLFAWFLLAYWRMHEGTGAWRWAAAAGVLAGTMAATKETAAVILPCVAGAVLIVRRTTLRNYVLVGAASVVAVLVFFSDFGLHPSKAFDLFRAIAPQIGRGTGNEHAHPWYTYFQWTFAPTGTGIPWSGWLVAGLALVGCRHGWANPFLRTVAVSAALLIVVFTALPYKTPWLMLIPLFLITLLAGAGLARIWSTGRSTGIVTTALLGALLATDTYARCLRSSTDPENALAYSPSSPDLARLENDLNALLATLPDGRETVIQVIATDYWPLPWTLRHFPRTGYWPQPVNVWDDAVVLTGPEYIGQLGPLSTKFRSYTIRPGVFILLRESLPAR